MSEPRSAAPDATEALPAGTAMGAVTLVVPDAAHSQAFYERVLGLTAAADLVSSGTVALAASAHGEPLVRLREDPRAPDRGPRAPGLFHLALLLPSRDALGAALRRLAGAGWRLTGASDHLVSEALYLSDPDGNGIELYRDRPREEWPREADGSLRMATLPLDLRALATAGADGDPGPAAPIAAGTRMGHVHLQVSEVPAAEAFYHGALGFDVTVRAYPGALFVSAGGYHHHLGLNTWNSAGSPPRRPGDAGLERVEIVIRDTAELERAITRLDAAGAIDEPAPDGAGALVRDPFGTGLHLRAA